MAAPVSTAKEYFDTIRDRFVADEAKGITAAIQYDLGGDGGGTWVVKIEDGQIADVAEGPAEKPTLTINMEAGNFLKMANGELDGTKAFMTRKLKVKGNIAMAQKMRKFMPPSTN